MLTISSAFKQISRWLPANDQVVIRCIHSMEFQRRIKRAYTHAEVKEVTDFLQLPGNERLDAAFTEIIGEWDLRREARQVQQQYQESVSESVSGADDGSSKDATPVDQDTGSKQAENENKDEKKTPRRRDRRAQKAKGKQKQAETA